LNAPAVEVDGLTVRFRQRDRTIHAVNGVTFRLARGEVLGILGESGSGKSVTLRSLMRLLPHNCAIEGRILLDGQDIQKSNPATLRRGIGYVFQEGRLFPHLNVRQNLGYGRWFAPKSPATPEPKPLGGSEK